MTDSAPTTPGLRTVKLACGGSVSVRVARAKKANEFRAAINAAAKSDEIAGDAGVMAEGRTMVRWGVREAKEARNVDGEIVPIEFDDDEKMGSLVTDAWVDEVLTLSDINTIGEVVLGANLVSESQGKR